MRLTYRAALRLLAEPDVTGRKRERNGEAGVELIEFGLVFPLLLLLVLGIVDYGFMFQRFEALTNATREGARVASLPGLEGKSDDGRRVERSMPHVGQGVGSV